MQGSNERTRNSGNDGGPNRSELSPSIREPIITRKRYATRSTTATAARESEKQNTTTTNDQTRARYLQFVNCLFQMKLISKADRDQYFETANTIPDNTLMAHLKQTAGEDRIKAVMQCLSTANMSGAQRAVACATPGGGIRQGTPLTNVPPGSMSNVFSQRMMSQFGTVGTQALAKQGGRLMSYGPKGQPMVPGPRGHMANIGQQWNPRQGTFPYEIEPKTEQIVNFSGNQRTAQNTGIQTRNSRSQSASSQASGEVVRGRVPGRPDAAFLQYNANNYAAVNSAQGKSNIVAGYAPGMQMTPTGSGGPSEQPTNKRVAPTSAESNVAKAAKYSKNRRPAEDPSAPDAGEIDAVMEASIHLGEEQRALLSDIPSQVASDAGGHVIESNLLNIGAVKSKINQVVRDRGMQLSGNECIDVLVQGMEEKFEGFLKKALKLAIHRVETSTVAMDTDTLVKTSDVRTKFRETKKKQEARKASKVREEREKLEQLAETASKKELANNKELAAKVEKVKREKQFNAETEAANRALSKAFGGIGFERFRKILDEKEGAPTAASSVSLKGAHTTQGASSSINAVVGPTSVARPSTMPQSLVHMKPREEKKQVVLGVKDLLTVMSQDSHYCFSPLLYRLYL